MTTVIRHDREDCRQRPKPVAKASCITRCEPDTKHGIGKAHPHALYTVKNWCAKLRKQWRQALLHTGCTVAYRIPKYGDDTKVLDITPLGDEITPDAVHPRLLVVRVIGTPDSLEALACYNCVALVEHVMTTYGPQGEAVDEAGVPYVLKVTAQGSGEPKPPRKPSNTMTVYSPTAGGNATTYQDTKDKKTKPCGSRTEYESLTAARKDSDNTHAPKTTIA